MIKIRCKQNELRGLKNELYKGIQANNLKAKAYTAEARIENKNQYGFVNSSRNIVSIYMDDREWQGEQYISVGVWDYIDIFLSILCS